MASNTVTFTYLYTTTLIVSISIDPVVAEFCHNRGYNIDGFICPRNFDSHDSYKCCGTSESEYCCTYGEYSEHYGWRSGKIAGIVLGTLFFVGFLCVIFVCFGSYVKKRRKQRRATTVSRTTPAQHCMHRLHTVQCCVSNLHSQLRFPAGRTGHPQARDLPHRHNPTEGVAQAPLGHAQPPPSYHELYPPPSYSTGPKVAPEMVSPLPSYNLNGQTVV